MDALHGIGLPASNEHGNPSGNDLEGEIDHPRLQPRNGAEPVISTKGSIVAAGKRHYHPAKVHKGPTASHGRPPCVSQGSTASQGGSDDARDGTAASQEGGDDTLGEISSVSSAGKGKERVSHPKRTNEPSSGLGRPQKHRRVVTGSKSDLPGPAGLVYFDLASLVSTKDPSFASRLFQT